MPFLFHPEHNIRNKDPKTQAKMRTQNLILFCVMMTGCIMGLIVFSPIILTQKIVSFFTQNSESEIENG